MNDINIHFREIESLKDDLIRNLDQTTTGNLSHKMCFNKYLARKIAEECNKLQMAIGNTNTYHNE